MNALIRFFDFILALVGLLIFFPVMLLIAVIGFFDTGSPLFLQDRVGRNKRSFTLWKFRTMTLGTAEVATHLAHESSVTKFGFFLRRTKLDELPQLWNVLKGDMSLVGPRPCLKSQNELINRRDELGVFSVRPGITGLAQISNIDMSTPSLLAQVDADMILGMSVGRYFQYILLTLSGRGSGDRIRSR